VSTDVTTGRELYPETHGEIAFTVTSPNTRSGATLDSASVTGLVQRADGSSPADCHITVDGE